MKTKKELERAVKISICCIAIHVFLTAVHVASFNKLSVFDWVFLTWLVFFLLYLAFSLGGVVAGILFLEKQSER